MTNKLAKTWLVGILLLWSVGIVIIPVLAVLNPEASLALVQATRTKYLLYFCAWLLVAILVLLAYRVCVERSRVQRYCDLMDIVVYMGVFATASPGLFGAISFYAVLAGEGGQDGLGVAFSAAEDGIWSSIAAVVVSLAFGYLLNSAIRFWEFLERCEQEGILKDVLLELAKSGKSYG